MDSKRLAFFCTIVEQGQISRAARVLNISQPPLSQHLKGLEDELGVQLIVREGHAWQVTEAGKALYESARRALDQLAEIPAEVKNAADGFAGRISIGVSSTCQSYITAILPELCQKFPRLMFRLLVADSSMLENKLTEREVDFAVLLAPLKYDHYRTQMLPMDHFSVVFSSRTMDGPDQDSIRLGELRGVPLLLSRQWEGGGMHLRLLKRFRQEGVDPRILLDSPSIDALLRVLETSVDLAAILPDSQIPKSLRERCRVCRLDYPDLTLQPVLVHLTDRYLTTAIHAVMAAILGDTLEQNP